MTRQARLTLGDLVVRYAADGPPIRQRMTRAAWRVAPLLFGSGMCALIYQVAWLREFRLVFGASTAASAAVLAIFIGGLGVGGLLLGPRADRRSSPLAFYARLETVIGLSAAATPGLLWVVRTVYVALGGSSTLGLAAGTALRLVLAALVLALPTFLMGGTLPAAARAVEGDEDRSRRAVALLYGVNTLGAVTGAFLPTFFMLEVFGTRRTLWLACLVNMLVAQTARSMARGLAPPAPSQPPRLESSKSPAWFVLAAAAIVGFAFLVMELVWYRMLAPLLGGTVFTFGLILTVALLGIGLGGAFYSLLVQDRPVTLRAFAWTCLLEAAAIAFPYALGDRIAVLALLLRSLGSLGFWGHVLAWTSVTALVVLPAAFVAGVQFPVLIALLGRGRENVGREIGLTYAWNTAGAIAGSLAGGFGLLPMLSAPGCWRAVAGALLALGLLAVFLSLESEGGRARVLLPVGLAVGVGGMLGATGPTAAWRHSGIGAGRATLGAVTTPNGIRNWLNLERRALRWEGDGVEGSVAMQTRAFGLSFSINGKIDGHATEDAPTQVMSGLLGTVLHPHPQRALVVGLGTGSTAGWLGAVPRMERVDVVELESGVLEVARACAAVNRDVLSNPKVHVTFGDAREVVLATPRRYDVIFSEPSNPYRAGIASLFTQEYYRAVAGRLDEDGLFIQWVQAYEVDSLTVRRIYATLQSAFPVVETWRTDRRNLLLVGAKRPVRYPVAELRGRIREEPYRSALLATWRVSDLEGLLAHFVAGPSFARAIAEQERGVVNTDDRNEVEFGFARAMGLNLLLMAEITAASRTGKEDRPALVDGDVDWARVEDERLRLDGGAGGQSRADLADDQRARALAYSRFLGGDDGGALAAWRSQGREPSGPAELAMVAAALADAGDEGAARYVGLLRALEPTEADVLEGRLRLRQGRFDEAAKALEAAFARHRQDPWLSHPVMRRAFDTAIELASREPALAAGLFGSIEAPFATLAHDPERARAALEIAAHLPTACALALAPLEPHVPWERSLLEWRSQCYAATHHALAEPARADVLAFLRSEPTPFAIRLGPAP